MGPINIIPALVQIMAWRRPGDKPLSEPMMVSLLTHICVTRPQWVNSQWWRKDDCSALVSLLGEKRVWGHIYSSDDVQCRCGLENKSSPQQLTLIVWGLYYFWQIDPDSKVHGANMGPTWVLSAPDGPHISPMNFAIRLVNIMPVEALEMQRNWSSATTARTISDWQEVCRVFFPLLMRSGPWFNIKM